MTEEVADTFKLGINILLSAMVISGMGICMTNLQTANANIAEQQRFTQEYKEYREFSAYDDKTVRPQDIVTAVMTYKGDVGVYVWNSNTSNYQYKWDRDDSPGNPNATEYTATAILKVLNQTKAYSAQLQRGYNGEVTGIYFKSN